MQGQTTTQQTPTPSEVIDRLGGTVETAALCEVSSQAVSQWRRDGIPRAREKFLRVVRPDAFAVDKAAAGANA